MATKRTAKGTVGAADAADAAAAENAGKMTIPVVEERAAVGKRVVESGRVRISKRVRARDELVDVPLFQEEVRVERVPVNLFVESLPPVRQEGDTMIIPVVEERVVVEKKLVLVEELHVTKEIIERHEPQTVRLRQEEVTVKRIAGGRRPGRSGDGL